MTTEQGTTEQQTIDEQGLKKATRKGIVAAVAIAILSVIEYYIAVEVTDPVWALMPFIVAKGWIILDTFMHIRALWSDDH